MAGATGSTSGRHRAGGQHPLVDDVRLSSPFTPRAQAAAETGGRHAAVGDSIARLWPEKQLVGNLRELFGIPEVGDNGAPLRIRPGVPRIGGYAPGHDPARSDGSRHHASAASTPELPHRTAGRHAPRLSPRSDRTFPVPAAFAEWAARQNSATCGTSGASVIGRGEHPYPQTERHGSPGGTSADGTTRAWYWE
jgi:hypothetical protein